MINFNKNCLALDGQEVADTNIGKIVGQSLIQSGKGDALKFWHWANKMYKGEELDLDPTDTDVLRNFIKENETMTIWVKAQALECFK
jgi:hypothetical protein